jgi:hypothetical protein
VRRGTERSTKKDLHPRYSIKPLDAVLKHTKVILKGSCTDMFN